MVPFPARDGAGTWRKDMEYLMSLRRQVALIPHAQRGPELREALRPSPFPPSPHRKGSCNRSL